MCIFALFVAKLNTVQGVGQLSIIFLGIGGRRRFFCLKHKWPVDVFFVWMMSTILTFTIGIHPYPITFLPADYDHQWIYNILSHIYLSIASTLHIVCFTNLGKLNLPMMVRFKAWTNFLFCPACLKNITRFKSCKNWLKNNNLATLILKSCV